MPLTYICTLDKNHLVFNRDPVLIGDPVSWAQLTAGLSLPQSTTAHARPTYMSSR